MSILVVFQVLIKRDENIEEVIQIKTTTVQ